MAAMKSRIFILVVFCVFLFLLDNAHAESRRCKIADILKEQEITANMDLLAGYRYDLQKPIIEGFEEFLGVVTFYTKVGDGQWEATFSAPDKVTGRCNNPPAFSTLTIERDGTGLFIWKDQEIFETRGGREIFNFKNGENGQTVGVPYFDGKYMVLYTCLQSRTDGTCEDNSEFVEISSNDKGPLPLDIQRKLYDLIEEKLCFSPDKLAISNFDVDCSNAVREIGLRHQPEPSLGDRITEFLDAVGVDGPQRDFQPSCRSNWKMYEDGDVWQPEGVCARYRCTSGEITTKVCWRFVLTWLDRECYVVEEREAPYPSCCPRKVCPGDGEWSEEAYRRSAAWKVPYPYPERNKKK